MKRVLYSILFSLFFFFLGVSVLNAQAKTSWNFESSTIGDSLQGIGWNAATDVKAKIADDPVAPGNKVLRVVIGNYNAAPVLMFVLPAGKTLANYKNFTFKSYWAQGDVGYKDIVVEAYQTRPTAQAFNNAAVKIGHWNRNAMGSTAWEDIAIDITNATTLHDTIYIAFGINCAGTGNVGGTGVATTWYADNVTLSTGDSPDENGFVTKWGASPLGNNWKILNRASSAPGEGYMGGTTAPTAWATIRGGFDSVVIATGQTFTVKGKLEFIGDGMADQYTPIRYALTYHSGPDTLLYQNTDSAKWVGTGGGGARGYSFMPVSGNGTLANGTSGSGTNYSIRGANWNTTNAGAAVKAIKTVYQVPLSARMVQGVYDWAISVTRTTDSTNEVRWYLVEENEKYWYAGTAQDSAVVNTFDGVAFGIINNLGNNLTGFKLTEVKVSKDTVRLTVPLPPFEPFWVSKWGETALGTNWKVAVDSNTIVGDAGIFGDTAPTAWATIRGGFDYDVEATTDKPIIVSGKLEFVGDGMQDQYTPIRYALTYHPDLGTLQNQYTDSALWVNTGAGGAIGYSFMPISGNGTVANGSNGAGTVWSVNGANWTTTYNANVKPLKTVYQVPMSAQMVKGVYDWAISVKPLANGLNQVKWYLIEENEKYWTGGSAIDSAHVTTKFNGIAFGVINGLANNLTGFNLYEVRVDKGELNVPLPPFQPFWVSKWGETALGTNWKIGVDSNTIVGDANMHGDAPPSAWATIRGGFDYDVEATNAEPIKVTGKLEFVGDGMQDQYTPIRYALTYHQDAGTLQYQYTDSAFWNGTGAGNAFGYSFMPVSGNGTLANGSNGGGTTWSIGGANWTTTYNAAVKPIATVYQIPTSAQMVQGVYDWGIGVKPLPDGTNEVKWYLVEQTNKYWFGGTAIDSSHVTTKFNGIAFGVINGLGNNLTGFNLSEVRVEKGALVIPNPPFQQFYIPDWAFISRNNPGWTITPGEFTGNVSASGTGATDWVAIRGGFGQTVMLRADTSLVITGTLELTGGGFEAASSLRLGLFYSDSAKTIDSTSWTWRGTENGSSGYLFMPLSGSNAIENWNGNQPGTVGGVVNGAWLNTDAAGDYALSANKQYPRGAVGAAGTYNFKMSLTPMGNGTEVRYYIYNNSYQFGGIVMDNHSPLATTKFNSFNIAVKNAATTGIALTDFNVDLGDTISIPVNVVGVAENGLLPVKYALSQNYPNPFNPSTTIEFAIPNNGNVRLTVYDALGRVVTDLVNGELEAGYHKVTFNAANLASGVYFYKIKAGDFVSVKKLMLLK